MTSALRPSRYKDQPAITLESAKIAAQFLPGIGAKMCSLIYKPGDGTAAAAAQRGVPPGAV